MYFFHHSPKMGENRDHPRNHGGNRDAIWCFTVILGVAPSTLINSDNGNQRNQAGPVVNWMKTHPFYWEWVRQKQLDVILGGLVDQMTIHDL